MRILGPEKKDFTKEILRSYDYKIAKAQRLRGRILRDMRRFDKALAAYDEAIRLVPNSAVAYQQRGWLHERQSRFKLALADYERAAKLKDADDWLKRRLESVRPKAR